MALELGDVIAQIGGAGGGADAVPYRYVHDFGHTPIPVGTAAGGTLTHEVPGVPEGATIVATLEWTGPETGGPAVVMWHEFDYTSEAIGVAGESWSGFPPVTVVATAGGKEEERGLFTVAAVAEGYTATKLTAIIIPAIK